MSFHPVREAHERSGVSKPMEQVSTQAGDTQCNLGFSFIRGIHSKIARSKRIRFPSSIRLHTILFTQLRLVRLHTFYVTLDASKQLHIN